MASLEIASRPAAIAAANNFGVHRADKNPTLHAEGKKDRRQAEQCALSSSIRDRAVDAGHCPLSRLDRAGLAAGRTVPARSVRPRNFVRQSGLGETAEELSYLCPTSSTSLRSGNRSTSRLPLPSTCGFRESSQKFRLFRASFCSAASMLWPSKVSFPIKSRGRIIANKPSTLPIDVSYTPRHAS